MTGQTPRPPNLGDSLTPREIEILTVMADVGGSATRIGRLLYIEPTTVKTHLRRISLKLGTAGSGPSTTAHSFAVAWRTGLLDHVHMFGRGKLASCPSPLLSSDVRRAERELARQYEGLRTRSGSRS